VTKLRERSYNGEYFDAETILTWPLEGLTIVEVSAFIAGPYAGLNLAQMGAEVIRIDPIGGGLDYKRWPVTEGGNSLYWNGLNKGKKSVTLNVRDPRGREIAHALMTEPGATSGIVVTNLPATGWLDYELLKSKRDNLIMVNIVGQRDGSIALDYTVNARAGFPLITGPVGLGKPVNQVVPVWDVLTGMSAANAVLIAEQHRQITGEGQYVRIALADTAFSVLSHLGYVAEAQINKVDRSAEGNHVFGTFGCDFETFDSGRVMITAFTRRHWQALLEATNLSSRFEKIANDAKVDLQKEDERYRMRHIIEAELKPWFKERTLNEIRTVLDEKRVCWAPYQSVRECIENDPDMSVANPMFQEIYQPGVGTHLAAGLSAEFGALNRRDVVPAPLLGQDTQKVISNKLGFSVKEIEELQENGII
tara:strand:+ start:2795 stop:4057 length:1263 start_codon:yes stop_codon:yes gene_type:complete